MKLFSEVQVSELASVQDASKRASLVEKTIFDRFTSGLDGSTELNAGSELRNQLTLSDKLQ